MGKFGIGFNDAGRFRVFPAVSVTVKKDARDLVAQGPTGVIAIVGPGAGFFPPKVATPLPVDLGSPERFLAPGDLVNALNFAVRPFPDLDRAVSQNYVVPVTPAVQASLDLVTTATVRATLKAKMYGNGGTALKVTNTAGPAPQTLTVKLATANEGTVIETYQYSTVAALVEELNARSALLEATFATEGIPDAIAADTPLGGANLEPTPQNTDWSDALNALNGLRINCISVVSSSGTIQTMLHDYAVLHRNRGYVGGALQNWNGVSNRATAMTALKAAAAAIAGKRMMHVGLGAEGQPGYVFAARYAALAGALEPSVPMTFKRLNVASLEAILDLSTEVDGVDGLLMGGVAVPVRDPQNPGDFIVSRGLSTLASSDNLYDREHSVLAAVDALQDQWEAELREVLGGEGTEATLQRAITKTIKIFDQATRPSSAVRINGYRRESIVATFSSDTVVHIEAAVTPIPPVNFVKGTLNLERTEIKVSADVPVA